MASENWRSGHNRLEAVLRKIEARCYQLNHLRIKEEERKKVTDGNVFVKGLDRSVTDLGLFKMFSPFGAISVCKVAADPYGLSKGTEVLMPTTHHLQLGARFSWHLAGSWQQFKLIDSTRRVGWVMTAR